MNLYDIAPVAAALDAVSTALQLFSTLLAPLAGTGSAALAVVALTVLVRLALVPVGLSQARAQRMRVRLAPRLAELQRRHRSDPQRLQRETMALYSDEGASPLAGCLPLLVQAPVLSLVYGVFILPTINGHPNALLSESLAGAPLGVSLQHALLAVTGSPDALAALLVPGILLVLLTAVALLSRRFTLATAAAVPASAAPAPAGRGSAAAGSAARGSAARGSVAPGVPALLAPGGGLQSALSWLPLATVVVAVFVPLAAMLYLLVTTTWTLLERLVLHRLVR
jgi:YidC/Oxa1 family membrane protein insertase